MTYMHTDETRALRRLTTSTHYESPAPVATDIEFGDPETVTCSQLRVGDFVVAIPAYMGIRGMTVNSAIKTIGAPALNGWHTQSRPRGPKFPILSRLMTFVSSAPSGFDYPNSTPVIVRRPIVSAS